jgi:hypothetical protein
VSHILNAGESSVSRSGSLVPRETATDIHRTGLVATRTGQDMAARERIHAPPDSRAYKNSMEALSSEITGAVSQRTSLWQL